MTINTQFTYFQQILHVFLHLLAKDELESHLPFFFPPWQLLIDFKSLQAVFVVVAVFLRVVVVLAEVLAEVLAVVVTVASPGPLASPEPSAAASAASPKPSAASDPASSSEQKS